MSSSTPESDSLSAEAPPQLAPRAERMLRRSPHALRYALRYYPLAVLTGLFLLVVVVAAIFAGVLAPFDPEAVDPVIRLQGPSWSHIMGTDPLGRDQFSRIIFGARSTFVVAVGSVALAAGGGLVVGLVSGYLSGWTDAIMQRLVDILLSFPGLTIVISLAAFFGTSKLLLIVAIGFSLLGASVRVARGATLQVSAQPYVEAAQAMGAWTPRVIFRHIMPNILAPVVVIATAFLGIAILIEASASFLGFGIQPPEPSWGAMLGGDARAFLSRQPWLSVFPGLAIFATVYSFNILGDTLRDITDPRLRGSR